MTVTLAAQAVSVCPFCPLSAAPWAILTCVMGLTILGFSPSTLCFPQLLISWLSDSCCHTSAPDTRQRGGFSRFSLVRMCVQAWDPCSLWARDSRCHLFGCIPALLVDSRSEASATRAGKPGGLWMACTGPCSLGKGYLWMTGWTDTYWGLFCPVVQGDRGKESVTES